jgi:hypothetical protein
MDLPVRPLTLVILVLSCNQLRIQASLDQMQVCAFTGWGAPGKGEETNWIV